MPNATQGGDPSASTKPAALSPEIERLIEDRIKGFQRLVGEKDTLIQSLRTKLNDAEDSGLTADEALQRKLQRREEENAQLRAQLELAQLRSDYGDVMDDYQSLLSAPTAKDQLELLKKLRVPATNPAAAAPAATDNSPEVPDVDLNNPMRGPFDGIRLPDGTLMDDVIADKILGAVGRLGDVTQQ